MKAERGEPEEKSSYGGERREQLEIVKTLVAMANTRGGTVLLKTVACDRRHLNSAT